MHDKSYFWQMPSHSSAVNLSPKGIQLLESIRTPWEPYPGITTHSIHDVSPSTLSLNLSKVQVSKLWLFNFPILPMSQGAFLTCCAYGWRIRTLFRSRPLFILYRTALHGDYNCRPGLFTRPLCQPPLHWSILLIFQPRMIPSFYEMLSASVWRCPFVAGSWIVWRFDGSDDLVFWSGLCGVIGPIPTSDVS